MNILQLRAAFEDNGPGTQALTIGEELRRRGHRVIYAASGGDLLPKIAAAGFPVLLVPELARDKRDPLNFARSVLAVARAIREEGIDVVHTHNAAATFTAYFASRPARVRPRLVRSVRGVEVRPTHQWRNLVYRLYPATLLAVSDFTRQQLVQLGATPDRIVVTYNGVDIRRFTIDRAGGEDIRSQYGMRDKLVIGHVGRFSGWKGQQILVEALARIRGNVPPAALVLVGDGPARASVEKRAAELGVRNDVVFAGFRTDVERFHPAFDIYAQPSTMGEMLPNSILESMACGNPWVGSRISGLEELADGGGAGIVTSPGDVNGLAGSLRMLLNDSATRTAMGARARKVVEERFTIERVVDRILRCYEGAGVASPDTRRP